ncbi:MAG: hemolysin family protein [Acidobacteria bacterium]|nr:hemolysin family protein [Acidobacteriota bacterium]
MMPASDLLWLFLGLGLLLLCSAFFSGSETALSALTKVQTHRMRNSPRSSHRAVVRFLDDPRRLFITVLFGNTLVNMAFISVTGSFIYNHLFQEQSSGLAFAATILIETALLLVLGEITPKTYAIKHSVSLSQMIARPLWFFSTLIFPFRRILRSLTNKLLSLFNVSDSTGDHPLTSAEFKSVIEETEKLGALGREEGEIIHSIFELHDIKAREPMVPRPNMVCIEVSSTIRQAFALTKKSGYSRLPVYRVNTDNICGIFYVKDLALWRSIQPDWLDGRSVEDITIDEFLKGQSRLNDRFPELRNTLVRSPYFIINTKKIGPLIRDMTRDKQQMAVLLDEFGGVTGLITVEDIVEEVLGEITDEYDLVAERAIAQDKKDPCRLTLPGYVSIRSFNKRLNLKLDEGLFSTMAGYVIQLFGHLPEEGEVVYDALNRLEFMVLQKTGARIDQLSILQKKKEKKTGRKSLFAGMLPLLFLTPLIPVAGPVPAAGGSSAAFAAYGLALLVSLLLMAFFNGAETGIVSASSARIDVLAQKGDRRAVYIDSLMENPDKMLGLVLVGTNLMTTVAGVAGLQLFFMLFPDKAGLQELLNTLFMTVVILIFCEILPKTIFRARADRLALKSALPLRISSFFLYPIVSTVTRLTNAFVRLAGESSRKERMRVMREELILLAKLGETEGVIRREQLQMVQSVLELESKTVESIMTPLIEIEAVPQNMSVSDFFRFVTRTGHSRFPVYKERIDNIIGIVHVRDVLYATGEEASIESFIKKDISLLPDSKKVFTLLRELKKYRRHMAFVVDEYGGIIGLVTVEDLVEEIMGDIRDETDREEDHLIRVLGRHTLECDGKTEIQKLNFTHNLDIPLGDYRTIAGYIIHLLEKIPRTGETLDTNTLHIVILESDNRMIRRVRIQSKNTPIVED